MKRNKNVKRMTLLSLAALAVSIGMSSCKSRKHTCPGLGGEKKHYKKSSYASTDIVITTDENV